MSAAFGAGEERAVSTRAQYRKSLECKWWMGGRLSREELRARADMEDRGGPLDHDTFWCEWCARPSYSAGCCKWLFCPAPGEAFDPDEFDPYEDDPCEGDDWPDLDHEFEMATLRGEQPGLYGVDRKPYL